MHGLRKLMLGSAAAALAITALGAPAAAADTTGTLAIVNGVPGQKIDVCIGNKEQRSGMGYGGVYQKDVIGTGPRLLRFYKKNAAKKCGGTKIASKLLNISAGDDLTIVVTKFNPKVKVFDNTGTSSSYWLGEIPPRGAPSSYAMYGFRNASEMTVNWYYEYATYNGPYFWFPATSADPIWSKGAYYQYRYGPSTNNQLWRVHATLAGDSARIAQRTTLMKSSRRHEWILVGTSKHNAKMVLLRRGVSEAS